jgi:hypothetical protein
VKHLRELALEKQNRNHLSHVPIMRLRRPTTFERVAHRLSFFDSVEGAHLLPELSAERKCFRCGHLWSEHDDSCWAMVSVMVSQSEFETQRCRCSAQKRIGSTP